MSRRFETYFGGQLKVVDRELRNHIENTRNNVYRVTWIGDPDANWLILQENVGMAGGAFRTKNEAVKEARKVAKRDRPSVLVVERKKPSKNAQSGVSDWTYYSSR